MRPRDYRPIKYFFIFLAGLLLGKFCFTTTKNSVSYSLFNGKPSKLQSVINLIDSRYVDAVDVDSLTELVIPDILTKLDPHSRYTTAPNRNLRERTIVGEFCGVGMEFTLMNDSVIALYTIPGGPCDRAGILPGDIIVKLDTITTVGSNAKTLLSALLKGKCGSKFSLYVRRQGADSLVCCQVTRDKIPSPTVPCGYMIDSVSGYIKITNFGDKTYEEFIKKLRLLRDKGVKNLVVDLRDNGGGRLTAAPKIASEFLSYGDTIVYTLDRDNKQEVYTDSTTNPIGKDMNLVCIVNYNTASASEILVSAIQDHDRGVILGLRTYGKGLVQRPMAFPDSSVVYLTTSRYYSPSGRCLQKSYGEYANDVYNRLASGELDSANAFRYKDQTPYFTDNGRKVYSGAGVFPDAFVPKTRRVTTGFMYGLDTAGVYYKFAARKYNMLVQRDSSIADSPKFVSLLFENEKTLLDNFVAFANDCNIKIDARRNRKEIVANQDVMLTLIKAYAYHIIGDDDNFYKYYNNNNLEINVAVDLLNDPDRLNEILGKKK